MKSKQGGNKRTIKKEKNNRSDKLIKIGIVLITIVFVFIIYKIFNMVISDNEKIDLSGETYYQYFLGLYEEYSGDMQVIQSGDNKQLVFEDGKTIYLDSTPIYYKDVLGRVLLPEKMAVVNPNAGSIYKTENFTNIIQDSKVMYAKKHKKDNTKNITDTFIYDGNDLYFFLEEVTITIGKKKYKLSPLSYAIVNYRQNVEFYDYDKDEYTILDEKQVTSSDVIATNKYKTYTINMSIDSFSTGSSDQLLIKNIDYLTELDY